MNTKATLTNAQRAEFAENGLLVIKQFHDLENDIRPIQRAIYEIISLIIRKNDLNIIQSAFKYDDFDSGYSELIARDRRYGGEIYDAVKQIPAFLRLISHKDSEQLFRSLRDTDMPGIGVASYGIRIDNPQEEQFRSQWHQEFLFQPQSLDGVVFWTPLVTMKPEMGPVIICKKSHRDGLCKYSKGSQYAQKSGAYQIGIHKDEEVVAKYDHVAPLTEPGDLLIMDFLTIHQSGYNNSNRSRWSCQSRFFNFREPNGIQIGWKASVTAGTRIESIFSDNFVEEV